MLLIATGIDPASNEVMCFQKEIEFLLERNADINVPSKTVESPLFIAVQFRKFDLAKLLIQNGADTEVTMKDGHTALTYSVSTRSLLLQYTKEWIMFILVYLLPFATNKNAKKFLLLLEKVEIAFWKSFSRPPWC